MKLVIFATISAVIASTASGVFIIQQLELGPFATTDANRIMIENSLLSQWFLMISGFH